MQRLLLLLSNISILLVVRNYFMLCSNSLRYLMLLKDEKKQKINRKTNICDIIFRVTGHGNLYIFSNCPTQDDWLKYKTHVAAQRWDIGLTVVPTLSKWASKKNITLLCLSQIEMQYDNLVYWYYLHARSAESSGRGGCVTCNLQEPPQNKLIYQQYLLLQIIQFLIITVSIISM